MEDRKSLLMFFLSLLSAMVMVYFLSLLTIFLQFDAEGSLNPLMIVAMQVLVFISPVILISIFFKEDVTKLIKFNLKFDTRILLWAIAGILILDFFNSSFIILQNTILPDSISKFLIQSLNDTQNFYKQLFVKDDFSGFLIAGFVGAVLPSICEEFYFRGLLQTSLSHKNKIIVIILPSVIFGIFHFQPAHTFALIFIGIFLALITHYSNSIIPAIIIHFINNLKSIIMLNLFESESYETGLGISILILSISGILIFLIIRKIRNLAG